MAISAEIYAKMPDSIRALVCRSDNPGKDAVLALFPDTGKSGAAVQRNGGGQVTYGGCSGLVREDVGFGDSGSAARFFNSFPPDPIIYHAKANKADRAGSKHPTVKPIGLMRHLIRHICPPGGTVLDPFAGSGTTAEAARLEEVRCVLMEQEPEYLDFLQERIAKMNAAQRQEQLL